MLSIRKILHPTDFSDQSRLAFEQACSLARDYDAEVLVLHVIPPIPVAAQDGVFIGPSEDVDLARDQLDRIGTESRGVSIGRRLVDGYPVEEILKVARTLPADLIVMGTHGRGGLSRLLMGSVAEEVMRTAPCPVMTVKTPTPAPAEEPAVGVVPQLAGA